jgi:hypothetical protein
MLIISSKGSIDREMSGRWDSVKRREKLTDGEKAGLILGFVIGAALILIIWGLVNAIVWIVETVTRVQQDNGNGEKEEEDDSEEVSQQLNNGSLVLPMRLIS